MAQAIRSKYFGILAALAVATALFFAATAGPTGRNSWSPSPGGGGGGAYLVP